MKKPVKTVLLTGATGFIGSRALELMKGEFSVIGLSKGGHGAGIYKVDLRDKAGFARVAVDKIDVVIHTAAAVSTHGLDKDIEDICDTNIKGLVNLLEFCHDKKARHVVFCSSIAVYGAFYRERLNEGSARLPESYYAMSKFLAEEIIKDFCKEKGMTYNILRFSSVYGPGQSTNTVMQAFVNQAFKEGKIHVFGSGARTQDFIYVDDAVQALTLAASARRNLVCNIGSGKKTTMNQLAGLVNKIFAGGAAEIIHRYDKEEDGNRYSLDISKAVTELGFQPLYTLSSGLKKVKAAER